MLLACGHRAFISGEVVRGIEAPVQEALTVAHGDWLFLIDTKYFRDVFPVQVKVSDEAQLVEAVEGHHQHQRYGSDFLHGARYI